MRILIGSICLLGLLALAAPLAQAEELPRIRTADLPVAGTCAPIRRNDVTHVMVGRKDRFGRYQVAALRGQVLNDVQLGRYLKEMAAKSPSKYGSEHSVWITAAHDHRWAHIVKVILHCTSANIYRIGVRVRSEATQRALGFPLFLPPAADPNAASLGKATKMPVRLQTFAKKEADARPTISGANPIERDRPKNPSDLTNVYVAATKATKRFGKTVATVRLATNATVQDAIRTLDMLYRGGCVGVRVMITTNIASPKVDVYAVALVDNIALGDKAPMAPPAVQPRSEPWGLYGANESGWTQLELVPIPDEASGGDPSRRVFPNFLSEGLVSAHRFEQAEASIRNWAQGLSTDLVAATRGGPQLTTHLTAAARRPDVQMTATKSMAAFVIANSLTVSTLLVSADLFLGQQGVGRVDFLLFLSPTQTQVVYARWRGAAPRGVPPALAQDPFGGGMPGQVRTFIEALLLRAKKDGAGTLPLADAATIMGAFPSPAHEWVRTVVAGRPMELGQLVQGLRGTRFDRAMIRTGQLTASARQMGSVMGLLYAFVVSEERQLRLNRLTAKTVK